MRENGLAELEHNVKRRFIKSKGEKQFQVSKGQLFLCASIIQQKLG